MFWRHASWSAVIAAQKSPHVAPPGIACDAQFFSWHSQYIWHAADIAPPVEVLPPLPALLDAPALPVLAPPLPALEACALPPCPPLPDESSLELQPVIMKSASAPRARAERT